MKKNIIILLLMCCAAGCIGVPIVPRRISPDMDNAMEHTIRISDNVIKFSLPKGYYQFDNEAIRKTIDINDESLYKGGPSDALAEFQWDWQPRVNVNGTLKLSFWMEKFVEGEKTIKENTLLEIYNVESVFSKEYGIKDRFKGSVQYSSNSPRWFRWDGIFSDGNISDGLEIFIFPLDNDHYLRVQFQVIDNSHGKPENQDWYAEAEDMVDQIMASITIDTGAEAATIEYGVPDLGLVKPGTLKYFDDISVRN